MGGKRQFLDVPRQILGVLWQLPQFLLGWLLGWLYLPAIGLPSLCWAAARRFSQKLRKIDYYGFYTERWADRLGGVER